MDKKDSSKTIVNKLINIAEDFASLKNPKDITFADAESYDYDIYNLHQEWQKENPDVPFKTTYPTFNGFWEELATWNVEDNWNREKCEHIIKLAKLSLEELQEDKTNPNDR